MLVYLWNLLLGHKSCVACHKYSAAPHSLCLYCEVKATFIRRAAGLDAGTHDFVRHC
jgi:hypothetical protein